MTPERILVEYLTEMGKWESGCAAVASMRTHSEVEGPEVSAAWDAAMQSHRQIFERFCSKTRTLRRQSLSYSTPRDYNPETEKIVATRALSVVEIETNQVAGLRKRQIYRFVLEDGQWRLYEKFIIAADGEVIGDEL